MQCPCGASTNYNVVKLPSGQIERTVSCPACKRYEHTVTPLREAEALVQVNPVKESSVSILNILKSRQTGR